VSAATAWEITIKRALGKIDAPDNLDEELARHRFQSLPITISHALAVGELPRHHNDPFDRILVAQSKVEDLTLVTRDENVKMYDVPFIAA
jgi:PIN domain nuclease of toxin-antitoxin system